MVSIDAINSIFESMDGFNGDIFRKYRNILDYSEEDCRESVAYSQSDVPTGVPEEFHLLVPVFTENELAWAAHPPRNDLACAGEFFLPDWYEFLTTVPRHLAGRLPFGKPDTIESLRVFDDQKFGGNGRLVLIDVRKDEVASPFWYYRFGEFFKMTISIEQYFEYLFISKGIYDWQLFFVEPKDLIQSTGLDLESDAIPRLVAIKEFLEERFGMVEGSFFEMIRILEAQLRQG